MHGLAWLTGSPNIEALKLESSNQENNQKLTQYIDSIVTAINPAILPDGSNISEGPGAQTDPHTCNKQYKGVDLAQLVTTGQRHTRCSPAYCLKEKNGKQNCRFGYPKDLQLETTIEVQDDGEVKLTTARNDPLIYSYNPFQLCLEG